MMYNRNNFNNQRNQQSSTQRGPSPQNNSNNQTASNFTSSNNQNTKTDNSVHDNINSNFENNPKLRGIDPLKLKIIMEIKNKSKNHTIEELLPEIMKINQELNRRNMSFTKNETELLLEVIEEGLPPEEKARFNMLKGFMNM